MNRRQFLSASGVGLICGMAGCSQRRHGSILDTGHLCPLNNVSQESFQGREEYVPEPIFKEAIDMTRPGGDFALIVDNQSIAREFDDEILTKRSTALYTRLRELNYQEQIALYFETAPVRKPGRSRYDRIHACRDDQTINLYISRHLEDCPCDPPGHLWWMCLIVDGGAESMTVHINGESVVSVGVNQ